MFCHNPHRLLLFTIQCCENCGIATDHRGVSQLSVHQGSCRLGLCTTHRQRMKENSIRQVKRLTLTMNASVDRTWLTERLLWLRWPWVVRPYSKDNARTCSRVALHVQAASDVLHAALISRRERIRNNGSAKLIFHDRKKRTVLRTNQC